MKDGLIRLTDEKNLFYDSIERLYRVRMYCPYCGKYAGCRCFDTLKKAESFMIDGTVFTCSHKCSLMSYIDDMSIDDVGDTMKGMGRDNVAYINCIRKKGLVNKIKRKVRVFIGYKLKYYFSVWRLKWYVFKYTGNISEKDAYEVLDTMEVDFDSVWGESC